MTAWAACKVVIVGVTGHRDVEQEPGELLMFARLSVAMMVKQGVTEIITGMARGWDLKVARAAFDQGIPYCAAIPFPGQPDNWDEADQQDWAWAVTRASRKVVVSPFKLNVVYLKRNEWIVNNCHELWSLWDSRDHGGTRHCVLYAEGLGHTVRPLWEPWLRFRAERT